MWSADVPILFRIMVVLFWSSPGCRKSGKNCFLSLLGSGRGVVPRTHQSNRLGPSASLPRTGQTNYLRDHRSNTKQIIVKNICVQLLTRKIPDALESMHTHTQTHARTAAKHLRIRFLSNRASVGDSILGITLARALMLSPPMFCADKSVSR